MHWNTYGYWRKIFTSTGGYGHKNWAALLPSPSLWSSHRSRGFQVAHKQPLYHSISRKIVSALTKLCGSRHNMPRLSPPSVGAEAPCAAEPTAPDRNVAVASHGEYVPTVTAAAAWCVNAAVSKAAWWPWLLTFWPWNWCPSHVRRLLPLCQF